MAESIPSLRRKLAEANAEIAALKARPVDTVEVIRRVEVPVTVEVERVRYERVEVPVTVYVTDPDQQRTIEELQEALRLCSQSGS